MFRGRNEGILQLSLNADPDAEEEVAKAIVKRLFVII